MSRRARVVAAYATVKLVDPISGGYTIGGFYRDAILPAEADPDAVAALVRREYAEWVDEPKAESAVEPEPEKAPEKAEDDDDKPKPYASKEAWLAYAISQRAEGVSEEDAAAALADKTKNDLIAEFG